jgi:hypothetical protein
MENKYPENIMRRLRQREDLEPDDTSKDEQLNRLSPSEAFAGVCNWEGLINYDFVIKGWIEDIYGFNIDEIKMNYFQHRGR